MHLIIIDDHPTTIEGVKLGLLAAWPDCSVAACATVDEALALPQKVDCVILDLRLTDNSDPAHNVQRIVHTGCPVVLFTNTPTSVDAGRAMLAGAKAVIGKESPAEVVRQAVDSALRGEMLLTSYSQAAMDRASGSDCPQLTAKEREVLILIGRGLPAKSIARKLNNKKSTIDSITKDIRRKYEEKGRQISSRVDFLACGLQDGYVHVEDLG